MESSSQMLRGGYHPIPHSHKTCCKMTVAGKTIKTATIQVGRLKTVRKKHILKTYLVRQSGISAKIQQSCSSDPFSLQSKQLQPDYPNRKNISDDLRRSAAE